MPNLIVIAGPNGAGKTTLTQYLTSKNYIPKSIPIINPDEFLKLDNVSNELSAGRMALEMRAKFLKENKSFALETTFSGHSEVSIINKALKSGYNIKLYYITLETPQDCIDRVKNRVVEGGHDVDDKDVIRRYHRSFENLLKISKTVNQLIVFDNSTFKRKMVFATSNRNIINRSKSFKREITDKLMVIFKNES